jgi:hypothetical protein
LIRSTTITRLAVASLALSLSHCGGVAPQTAAPPAPPAPTVTATAPATPVDYKNTVRWSTASEVENFGFDVYRGETADGPWTRLTEQPVLGAGTSDDVHKYEYVDRTIDPHKAYYYWVESISISGVREHFTPVIAAKPKLPPAP